MVGMVGKLRYFFSCFPPFVQDLVGFEIGVASIFGAWNNGLRCLPFLHILRLSRVRNRGKNSLVMIQIGSCTMTTLACLEVYKTHTYTHALLSVSYRNVMFAV